jgi:hypothetical protein
MWVLRLRDQVDDRDDQMAQLQAQISNLGSIAGAADTYQLIAASDASEAAGRIYVGDDEKSALLYMQVGEPTASRAYDVYANKGGTLIYAGEVKVNERGEGIATLPLDEPFASYESVQIDAKPLLTDGTDMQEPDTGDGVLAWHQPEEQPSIGDTNVEPSP